MTLSYTAKHRNRTELKIFFHNKAIDARKDVIRLARIAGGGHLGGGLSLIDILVVLYYHHLRYNPSDPKWTERDRFILSKGHGALGLYPILSDVGFFPAGLWIPLTSWTALLACTLI